MDDALRAEITNTLRMLAADAVERADSGHPGTPMALADLSLVLWHEFLRFDPEDTAWSGRDRFVLSCGHASMLQYGLLHLWGCGLSLDDLRAFRQWDSSTPGHPEVGHTAGIELTTGPLGQGVANSVGMALGARLLGARVDVPGDPFQVFSQRVFVVCSDGDLMEGVSSEAASLAGHWRLDNLVWLWDDNRITIDGDTELAFAEDIGRRFEAAGWRVLTAEGHSATSVRAALDAATTLNPDDPRPTFVVCRTHIGFGSPNKVDTAAAHGSPLGAKELAATKANLGWPAEPAFHVPESVTAFFESARAEKRAARAAWDRDFAEWRKRQPEAAARLDALRADPPEDLWRTLLDATPAAGATRKTSGAALNAAAARLPGLIGGSADLTGSNGLALKGAAPVGSPNGPTPDAHFGGRQMYFGIREHGMAAIANGLSLFGEGLVPFVGTFLVFADYLRPSLRLAALSGLRGVFVLTHDSVFLGEDGPTHQPIEHHWALRAIPGLTYFRPADGVEVAMAWAYALQEARGPVVLALTRQDVPALERPRGFEPRDVWRGAYALRECADPRVILVGTGSETQLCVGAVEALAARGIEARVVSMPSVERFLAQPTDYQEALLPSDHPAVVTVEAGITGPWAQLTGRRGLRLGIDRFGASAPAEVLAEKFGLTVPAVLEAVTRFLARP